MLAGWARGGHLAWQHAAKQSGECHPRTRNPGVLITFFHACPQLVDLLRELQKRCAAAGTPVQISKNYKFLAKDIMSWNDAWKDDAFAGGKIPGWVGWLQQRQAAGSTGSGSGAKGSAVV